jgi:ubiquinol-cytochrome c reductase iron-sulfur subunit
MSRVRDVARFHRCGSVSDPGRAGDHGPLARQARFHPAPDGGRDHEGTERAALRAERPLCPGWWGPPDLQATDANRTKPGKENRLVAIGICTHLGCVPKGQAATDDKGLYGGWFCPCHGSMYDTADRIRQGPAPRNLDIPPYDFTGDAKIRIG